MTARLPSATLVLLIGAVAAIAQEKWETFHPAADPFTIDTPFVLNQRGENGKDDWRKYYASKGDTYLYIFSEPSREAHQTATVVSFVKSQGWQLSIGKTLNERPLHFQDEFDYWHTIVSIDTGSRKFIVQAVSSDENSPVAERFVSTFKPGEPGPAEAEAARPIDAAAATAESPLQLLKPDDTGPGTGTGIGAGSGTGSGSGISAGGVRPPPPIGTRPLKILTKPRPGYTDLGRTYEINGTVILRVTFLESGQIGPVSVVKGLPFGLTNQAIIAAKHITFEPQVNDGQKTSVTKQVEYNFSIY